MLAAGIAILPHLLSGGAMLPLSALAGMLLAVLASGLAIGGWTARQALAVNVIPALRGE